MYKKYKILNSFGLQYLEDSVNKYINTGWVPIGGISYNSTLNEYMQAIALPMDPSEKGMQKF